MRITNRWLGIILLGVTLSSPVLITGCAEHATVRVYDPYYGDYHVWNDDEVVYYRQWIGETHRLTANSAHCRPTSNGPTGLGGTIIPITARFSGVTLRENKKPADSLPAGCICQRRRSIAMVTASSTR